ncbi:MAG: hypothetical protein J7M14_05485 [Planctomycetes bacterium]|nr:hypothetical protein [Planctomycetota bacterium]
MMRNPKGIRRQSERVRVVAHRGDSGTYPENTAVALAKAMQLDIDMIELDVRLTKDEQLVLIHNATVEKTTDGSGKVADLTLGKLKALDAGSWKGEQFRGQRLLTLGEALDQIGRQVRLNVHIKAGDEDRARLVPMVIGELTGRDMLDSAFVASDEPTIALSRSIEPRLEICNLSVSPVETYIARSKAVGCTILQPGNKLVTPDFVDAAHVESMEVNPFYADDIGEMRRLIACGVDGILTNYPALLLEILGE